MQALFIYPDFGTPDCYPDYTAHSGQLVEVGAEVEHECETDDRLFEVYAPDGWRGHAWASELRPSPASLREEAPCATR